MNFDPIPLFNGPHQQTILSWVFGWPVSLHSVTQTVELPDGDQILLEITTPKEWRPQDPTTLMIHGLCGSSESSYMIRIGRRLAKQGIRVIRMNMRACGAGKFVAKKTYHCGRSDDLAQVITWIKRTTPDSPLTLVGFSLGGNIALKFAGENPLLAELTTKKIIALSPATDILASIRLLGLRRNRHYEQHFIKELKEDIRLRYILYPNIPHVEIPDNISLLEFDEIYTAPQAGFQNALDYYRKSSSAWVIPQITVPTKMLYAADDPFVDWTSVNGLTLPQNIHVHLTQKGGHLGFLGTPGSQEGYRWMDNQVVRWITED